LEYGFNRNLFTHVDPAGVRHRLDTASDPERLALIWRWEKLHAELSEIGGRTGWKRGSPLASPDSE
jgi:hypothetical protein